MAAVVLVQPQKQLLRARGVAGRHTVQQRHLRHQTRMLECRCQPRVCVVLCGRRGERVGGDVEVRGVDCGRVEECQGAHEQLSVRAVHQRERPAQSKLQQPAEPVQQRIRAQHSALSRTSSH